jgi:hypothetical protein
MGARIHNQLAVEKTVLQDVRLEKSRLQYLQQHLKQARSVGASHETVLSSGVARLDALFAQAVRPGNIIEWGIPQGSNGRVIPLLFLRHNDLPVVWIYGDPRLQVYAPAWAGYGVDLRRLFFIQSGEPVKQLRPLFLDNSFRIIVLDAPAKLSRGELAFIISQARHNRQVIFLLRNYFLSQQRGTALAALRVNCWQNNHGSHSINVIKGKHIGKIQLQMDEFVL